MSAVDGLITGMNTSDIIRQLMQLERQPVVRMQAKKATADKAVTALQGLNTKFLALADLVKKLSTTAGWSRVTAAPSHPDSVSVNVAAGAAPTSLSFKVNSLAAAHSVYSAATYDSDTAAVSQSARPLTISYTDADGNAANLVLTNHDGTLRSIADAINGDAASPITARIVKTADAGAYRLELTAKAAGANSAFTVTGIRNPPTPEMTFAVATTASDAEILFGSSATPLSIKSSSNTFTDVAPGVTLTVKKADPTTAVTVEIATDRAKITDEVEKLVAAANEILKEIKTLTGYDAVTKKGGTLRGNTQLRELQSAVLGAVSTAVGGASAATAGLQLTRDGLLTFDKATFEGAFAANPAAVAGIFRGVDGGEGVATRLLALSERATKFGAGILPQAIDTRRSEIKRIDDTIATWDVRLAAKEARFRKQFAALETALGASQQQGNWLAGQIASLPRWDSN